MTTASANSGLSHERPFPGLRPYRHEDHGYFFGREDQKFALFRLLDHSRFVAVVGSSGSGKSSLVRAGLLPFLDEESSEAVGRVWKPITLHPGDTPLGNLATAMTKTLWPSDDANTIAARRERVMFALRRSSFGMADALREIGNTGDTSIILVIDQFEELFRYIARQKSSLQDNHRQNEATQFVQVLLAASRDRSLNVYVLLTMRSDFIGDCASFRGLPEAVSGSQFLVPSLTRDQREQAIRGPIRKAAASIAPELVERLLNDVGDDMDQLPVLQHSLLRLWEQAATSDGTPRQLTMEHYAAIGGIAGALSKHADEILAGLTGKELAVEQLFRAIAEIDGEGRIVRRARLFDELQQETGISAGDLEAVIDRFRADDCSFLTPSTSEVSKLASSERIDVGHEALLRCWERVSGDQRLGSQYNGWLRSEVADGRAYRVLLDMASSRAGRIPHDLVEARWKAWNERPRTAAWAERYGGHLEEVQRLFADSLEGLKTERARQRRQTLLRAAPVAAAILLLVAGVLIYGLYQQRQAAIAQKEIATQQKDIADQKAATSAQQATAAAQQATLANQLRAQAEDNLNTSIQAVTNLLTLLQQMLDSGEISVSVAKSLLDNADATSQKFAASDTQSILAARTTLAIAFADIYAALQDHKTALTYSRQAKSIAQKLVALDPASKAYQDLMYQADFNIGDAESGLMDATHAMQDYSAALAVVEPVARADPGDYTWQQKLAFILNKIGDEYDQQSGSAQAHAKALTSYQNALLINQKIADANPGNDSLQRDLATALIRVGDAEAQAASPTAAQLDDALAKYTAGLNIRKTLADKTPGDTGLQSNLSAAYDKLAALNVQKKKFSDAAVLYDLALKIRQTLAHSDSANATWQADLAYQYIYIGDMQSIQGNTTHAKTYYADAARSYQSALDIRQKLVDIDPKNWGWIKQLADAHTRLATAFYNQDNLASSLTERMAAMPQRVTLAAQFPESVPRARELADEYVAAGDIMARQADVKGAATQYQSALDAINAFVTKHPGTKSLDNDRQDAAEKLARLTRH